MNNRIFAGDMLRYAIIGTSKIMINNGMELWQKIEDYL